MTRELLRDVPRCRRMTREVGEHATALVEARVGVALAHYALGARLVHARIECELAAAHRVLAYRNDAPTRDHLGEARDIVLGVNGAYAERVQFENFARKILVQPAAAVLAGLRGRPDRPRVVEIDQHRRMGLDRLQHVAEAAKHVHADRLALEGPGDWP